MSGLHKPVSPPTYAELEAEVAYQRAILSCTDVGEATAVARDMALEEAAQLVEISCATSEAGEELAEQIRALKGGRRHEER